MKFSVVFVSNLEISCNKDYLSNIKEILIDSNNDFIPNLYERIDFEGTLKEKIDFRINERLSQGYHYLLVFYKLEIVGFTEILFGDSLVYNQYLFGINVGTTTIRKSFQSKGIAKLLYSFLDNLAVESKVNVVLRSTWSLNVRQLKLYERFGYTEIERIHNARGEGNDLLKFCKWFK